MLIQVGIRTINDHHREQVQTFLASRSSRAARWDDSLRLELTTPVYLSIDMDGLDPACAPGVSHREPGGPSTRQVLDLIQGIRPTHRGGRYCRIQSSL